MLYSNPQIDSEDFTYNETIEEKTEQEEDLKTN